MNVASIPDGLWWLETPDRGWVPVLVTAGRTIRLTLAHEIDPSTCAVMGPLLCPKGRGE